MTYSKNADVRGLRRGAGWTYLVDWQERFFCAENRANAFIDFRDVQGPDVARIPEGLASAPVQYVDVAKASEHALRFVAGMFGVEQNIQSHALSVAFGWAILYDE